MVGEPAKGSSKEKVEELTKAFSVEEHTPLMMRFLSIERGRRRKPRRLAENVTQVDREILSRRGLLHAVEVAVGRAEEEEGVEQAPSLAVILLRSALYEPLCIDLFEVG